MNFYLSSLALLVIGNFAENMQDEMDTLIIVLLA